MPPDAATYTVDQILAAEACRDGGWSPRRYNFEPKKSPMLTHSRRGSRSLPRGRWGGHRRRLRTLGTMSRIRQGRLSSGNIGFHSRALYASASSSGLRRGGGGRKMSNRDCSFPCLRRAWEEGNESARGFISLAAPQGVPHPRRRDRGREDRLRRRRGCLEGESLAGAPPRWPPGTRPFGRAATPRNLERRWNGEMGKDGEAPRPRAGRSGSTRPILGEVGTHGEARAVMVRRGSTVRVR